MKTQPEAGFSGRGGLLPAPAKYLLQMNFARVFFAHVYFFGARSKVMMTDMQIEWNDTNVNTVNYMSKYQNPAVARKKYVSC